MLSDAGGKTLRDRLLRGPACGVVLVRVFQAVAVGAFLVGEHALEETGPVLLEHLLDALGLYEIAAEADQNAAGREGDHEESSG